MTRLNNNNELDALILRIFARSRRPLTVREIHQRVNSEPQVVVRSAIYRLQYAGLVKMTFTTGGWDQFELRNVLDRLAAI